MRKIVTLCSLLLFALVANAQEINGPAPSPKGTISQAVGLSDIQIEYSRPSAKGRKIFGDLVPFGKMWRTGANASTKIEFSDKVTIMGTEVPAGKYAIYTVPNASEWTIILHKNLEYWGTGGVNYKEEEDQARFTVKTAKAPRMVETFTMGLKNLTYKSAELFLAWENTEVVLPIEVNTDEQMSKQIKAFMNPEPSYRPYYNAASYNHMAGKDLSQALSWVDEALKINKGFWVLHLKAKIQFDLKDYTGAISTAEASKKAAMEAKNDDYVALNDKLIAKAKSMK